MQYTVEEANTGSCLITLRGNFTFSDHIAFRTILATLAQAAPSFLIIDFTYTSFIDSAALGMLLLRQELRKQPSSRTRGAGEKIIQGDCYSDRSSKMLFELIPANVATKTRICVE